MSTIFFLINVKTVAYDCQSMPRIPERAKLYVIYRNATFESDTTDTAEQNG